MKRLFPSPRCMLSRYYCCCSIACLVCCANGNARAVTSRHTAPILQRTRQSWTDEEVARLMKRVQEGNANWTQLSYDLIDPCQH